MQQIFPLLPGVTLRCFPDTRFKHGCLSLQFLRPMSRQEAALNALLPAVLLRGCRRSPDLRAITLRLDDLYGAGIGTLVRRVGDWQTTGLYASFIEDRFALEGDRVLEQTLDFLFQLLLEPVLEDDVFRADYVSSEKQNLISAIESQQNDKRAYAMEQLFRDMCRGDSFGIPRLGEKEDVAAITPQSLYAHYRTVLRESPIELCYVGAAEPRTVANLLWDALASLERSPRPLAPQTPFRDLGGSSRSEEMDISQGKLCLGFTAPVTTRDPEFPAMQVLNLIFGGGMTSKLFRKVREELSLCYAIGSGFHGTKGILTVSAGIDCAMADTVRREIFAQLEACRAGQITQEELTAAQEAMVASLLATADSPGALENYYATAALSGLSLTPEAYIEAVRAVTIPQVAKLAQQLCFHSEFFLKGAAK